MEGRRPFIATYIMASRPFGVIYIGMTSNLYERSRLHREGVIDGFSKRYGCNLLVWYEAHDLVLSAIHREKALKRWKRAWKMQLIEQSNPEWVDLYPSLCGWTLDPRVKPEDDGEGSVARFLANLARHPDSEP